MQSVIPAHSRHIWMVAGGLFALGTGVKFFTYEIVKNDIKARGENDSQMCRRVLDIAGSPSPLSTSMKARTGLTHANQLPVLTAEERERLKALRVSKLSKSEDDIYEDERTRVSPEQRIAIAAASQQSKLES